MPAPGLRRAAARGPRGARLFLRGPRPTVLDSYEGSDAVVIARGLAVEKSTAESEDERPPHGVVATRMVVEKVYKGPLKVGDEMTFIQGGGADCVWTFDERVVGGQFLFYAHSAGKKGGRWLVSTCGRSTLVEEAEDDLLYLDNMDKVRGQTRIAGRAYYDSMGLSAEGRRIRFRGADRTYETKTDANGVYEIYGVPAGRYVVEPEMPAGWKIDGYELRQSPDYDFSDEASGPLRSVPIILRDKRHVGLDLRFVTDNAVRGKVYDPSGKPMPGVCVTALPADDAGSSGHDCTDENGSFNLTELPRGTYVLGVNVLDTISSRQPFGTFYYPNVKERARAAVITIGAGEVRDGIEIHVPDMEEVVTVEGVVLYADGKPVVDNYVTFRAEKAGEKISGDSYGRTDAAGRFALRILKGLKGRLYSEFYASVEDYPDCPKLEAILKKKTGRIYGTVETQAIEIPAERDTAGLELKFPFPSCKKRGQ